MNRAYRVPVARLQADGSSGPIRIVTEYAWSPWQARTNLLVRLPDHAIGYALAQ